MLHLDYRGGQVEPLQGWDPHVARVTVVGVDMVMDGVTDGYPTSATAEITPGGFIGVNEFRELTVYNVNPISCQADGGGWIQNWDHVHLSIITTGDGRIEVWNEAKTQQINLSQPVSAGVYYVKGVAVSSALRDITLRLTHDYTGFKDDIKLTVYTIDKVEWETHPDNVVVAPPDTDHGANLAIDDCPKNGGKRIFADKKHQDDKSAEEEMRKRVRVKATVKPAMANMDVYFCSFDVDDPSSDQAPIDLTGPSGTDNNGGGAGTFVSTQQSTNGSGQATVTFIVHPRPGNNYRVAATLDHTHFTEPYYLTQTMADENTPPVGVKFSPMLTVWRKLHIEFDTMDAPPASELFGIVTGYAADPSNTPYGINTDDPKWGTDLLVPNAATVVDGMRAYFDAAYIKVEDQWTDNAHATFDFVRKTSTQLAYVDVPGNSGYWCTAVGWAYESSDKKENQCPSSCTHRFYASDDDPEDEGVTPGYRASTYGVRQGESCMIFLEIIRDRGNLSVARVVSHEVGHSLGLNEAPYNPSTPFEADKDGIMEWSQPSSIPCCKQWMDLRWGHTEPDRFSYENIAYLRSSASD